MYRALATANRFAERGWRVTVISADRDTFTRYTGADLSLEEHINSDVSVVRVPFSWPTLEPNLRRWSRLRIENPRLWAKLRKWRDQIRFPEVAYGPWRGPIEKAAEQVHVKDPVDVVLTTANPHVAFTAGYKLHRKHGVPFIMDYRDAWLLDVFSGNRLHESGSRQARWEERLIKVAEQAWFVNEPLRRWHANLYPDRADRMRVVANGFDPDVTNEFHPRTAGAATPLRFGYIGTVSSKVPLAEFVQGWRHAADLKDPALEGARADIYGYLGFYATPRPDLLSLVESAEDIGLAYKGPARKAEIGQIYDTFDVLLLILGAGEYVTSGKVFEYAATGLPIVSIHDPGNATSDVLRDYPLWFPVSNLEPETIAQAIRQAADAARNAGPDVREKARQIGADFSRDRQLDPRIDELEALVEKAWSHR